MDKEGLVYVDLDGKPLLVGRLWGRVRRERESSTFEYDPSWLANPARFSVEPALQLGPGPFHTPGDLPMFGFGPDRNLRSPAPQFDKNRQARIDQERCWPPEEFCAPNSR